jgi:hypothetical protein
MTLQSKRNNKAELLYAARGGLCSRCNWARPVKSSKGSVFVMCRHEALPKYLPQPVLTCPHAHLKPIDHETLN